ncbi:hypothetical protein SRHO_G00243840 [Serrasalmus rhombeus]
MEAAKHLLWFCSQANQKGSMKFNKYLWRRYQYHSGPRMSVGASTQQEVKRCLRQFVGKCLLQRGTHPELAWVECENKPAYLSGGTDLSLSLPPRGNQTLPFMEAHTGCRLWLQTCSDKLSLFLHGGLHALKPYAAGPPLPRACSLFLSIQHASYVRGALRKAADKSQSIPPAF